LSETQELPVNAAEMRKLARCLSVDPTDRFCHAVQDAILGYGTIMLHGWWEPRRIRDYYLGLLRDPAKTLAKHRGDRYVRLLRNELLRRAGIDPLNPESALGAHDRMVAVLHEAIGDIETLIRRGRSDVPKPEQLFLQQIVMIARRHGCDLKLPSRNPGRNGGTMTPLYRFALRMKDLLAEHGVSIAASAGDRSRFARLARISRHTLLRGLEQAKAAVRAENR